MTGTRLLAAMAALALVASGCAFLDGEAEVTTTRRVIGGGSEDPAPQEVFPDTEAAAGTVTGNPEPVASRVGERSTPTSDAAGGNGSPTADRGELALGTIQPLNGAERDLGEPLLRTTRAWVADVNARGGIAGRRVVLHVEQACLNCQDEALLAARRLVEEKGAVAIVNTYMLTYAMSAATDYLESKGIPLIGGNSSTMNDLAMGPTTFFLVSHNLVEPVLWARFLHDVFADEGRDPDIGLTHLDKAQSRARVGRFTNEWERLGGRVVATESVPAEEDAITNMDSLIVRMRAAGAQGVFAADSVLLVFGEQAAQRQGWEVPWGAHSAWGEAVPKNCGDACDGAYTSTIGWAPPSKVTPGMQRYLDAMERYYPAATNDGQTIGGWLHLIVLEHVAEFLGTDVDSAALIAGFESLENLDVGLTVAPITTGPDDHMGIPADQFLQLRGTEWVPVGQPIADG